jgi:WD40 repeat protein
MARSRNQDRLDLQASLAEQPSGLEHYERMADYEKGMCLDWIGDAPSPVLREQRIYRLARYLRLTTFEPMYELGHLAFAELDDLYGPPGILQHLPPEEQQEALRERRVLGGNHERNYDDSQVWFRIVSPGEKLHDEVTIVYPRPCVLTDRTLRWLNYVGWDTTLEARECLDLPAHDKPPPTPHTPGPPHLHDLAAGLTPFGQPQTGAERHDGLVLAVALTPDGQRAVSTSVDATLRVWDAATGRTLHVLEGHRGPVGALALTADGAQAVSASADGRLRTWNLETGEPHAVMAGHDGEVRAVKLMEEREQAISGSDDAAVRTWHLPSGWGLKEMRGHAAPVLDVAVTGDTQRAVSASADGTLRVWDLESAQPQHVLAGHTGPVHAVAVAPTSDGERAISASDDATLRIWNLATGRAHMVIVGHGAEVRALVLADEGRQIVSGSANGSIRAWEVYAGSLQHIMAGHTGEITGLAATRDGQRVISTSRDGTLRVWDIATGQTTAIFEAPGPLTCCAASPGGELIVAGDEQGRVYFLRLNTA